MVEIELVVRSALVWWLASGQLFRFLNFVSAMEHHVMYIVMAGSVLTVSMFEISHLRDYGWALGFCRVRCVLSVLGGSILDPRPN